jgi:hypothetical protein
MPKKKPSDSDRPVARNGRIAPVVVYASAAVVGGFYSVSEIRAGNGPKGLLLAQAQAPRLVPFNRHHRSELSLLSRESVARAIYDALTISHPQAYADDFTLDETVTIDSGFHLNAVAAVLLIKLHDLAAQALAPLPETQRKTL